MTDDSEKVRARAVVPLPAWSLWLVIAVGIGLRMLVLCGQDAAPDYQTAPSIDEVHYRELARNLSAFRQLSCYSQGFHSSSTRSPMYPTVLAVVNTLSGSWARAHHLLNIVLELANHLLIFAVAALLFGRGVGLVSVAIYALMGTLCYYVTASTSEILAIALFLSSVYYGIRLWRNNGHWLEQLGFGLCYVALIHTRPAFLILTPVLVLIFGFGLRQQQPILWRRGLALFVIAALCLPWGIRNYRLHKAIVPVCTMAGWHLGAHARSLDELPVDLMWSYIYAPERRSYREGDYYREASREAVRLSLSEPLQTTIAGAARIVYAWGFREPYKRIFLPRAYVYPVYLGDRGLFLPMLDFEGLCYGLLLCMAFGIWRYRGGLRQRCRAWWQRTAYLLIFLMAYITAHIISIPMEQYRLVIEPLLVILGVGLGAHVLARPLASNQELEKGWRSHAPLIGLGATVVLFVVLYGFVFGRAETSEYAACGGSDARSYESIRAEQWASGGNLRDGQRLCASGVLSYPHTGLRFVPGKVTAIPADGMVAEFVVNKFSTHNPLGIGDVKLNFSNVPDDLSDGAFVWVVGKVELDMLREPIVNVERYEQIR